MNESPRGKLNVADLKNLGLLSVKAGAAYALTHFVTNLSGIDLGDNSDMIVVIATVVVDALVKLLNGPKEKSNG